MKHAMEEKECMYELVPEVRKKEATRKTVVNGNVTWRNRMGYYDLPQDRNEKRALVNTVMSL
jgi:hypothetical protein